MTIYPSAVYSVNILEFIINTKSPDPLFVTIVTGYSTI